MSLALLILYLLAVGVVGLGVAVAVQFWRDARQGSTPSPDARK
ncbi:MAG: hypothetical protein AB7S55_08915 [Thiomonas sp.]|jgi:hypothetical protein